MCVFVFALETLSVAPYLKLGVTLGPRLMNIVSTFLYYLWAFPLTGEHAHADVGKSPHYLLTSGHSTIVHANVERLQLNYFLKR